MPRNYNPRPEAVRDGSGNIVAWRNLVRGTRVRITGVSPHYHHYFAIGSVVTVVDDYWGDGSRYTLSGALTPEWGYGYRNVNNTDNVMASDFTPFLAPPRVLPTRSSGPGRLVFIERRDDRCSVYLTATGEKVYVAHGPGVRLLLDETLCSSDLIDLWQEFDADSPLYGEDLRVSFTKHLRSTYLDVEQFRRLTWCVDCEQPAHQEDTTGVRISRYDRDRRVCDGCCENYVTCSECSYLVDPDSTSSCLYGNTLCEWCLDGSYTYCEECDGYYRQGYESDHHHGGCKCAAPLQKFSIRNDGEPPLYNDTRVRVTLPSGHISDEGMSAIYWLLRNHVGYDAALTSRDIGPVWQTKDGNYTKRLSRTVYNKFKVSIPRETLSEIGNVARAHSTAVDFDIEVTRDLNLSAEEFGHEDSCWWQSYSDGRCALKNNGGFGLRTFNDYGNVTGRSWVMPLRAVHTVNTLGDKVIRLEPTVDTVNADAFVVFNGYGALSGYTGTRVISHMAGWTYRKVDFSCSPMYVNGDSGYLVAPEEIARNYTDGSLRLSVDKHADITHTLAKEPISA